MSLVRVTAIEPVNRYKPGDVFECPESEAREMEAMGLVKLALVPRNKMMPEPRNKANPTPAAGEDAPSFASPAAPRSPRSIAGLSPGGKRMGRPPGKSSR